MYFYRNTVSGVWKISLMTIGMSFKFELSMSGRENKSQGTGAAWLYMPFYIRVQLYWPGRINLPSESDICQWLRWLSLLLNSKTLGLWYNNKQLIVKFIFVLFITKNQYSVGYSVVQFNVHEKKISAINALTENGFLPSHNLATRNSFVCLSL